MKKKRKKLKNIGKIQNKLLKNQNLYKKEEKIKKKRFFIIKIYLKIQVNK